MPLWGNTDTDAKKPKIQGVGVAATRGRPKGATSPVTVTKTSNTFGAKPTQTASKKPGNPVFAHAGWVYIEHGTGPIKAIAINNPGAGYTANTPGWLSISGAGGIGANVSYNVNATGNVSSISIIAPGRGFQNTVNTTIGTLTVAALGTNTNAATFKVTFGGRYGRIKSETLVAIGSITGNNANNFEIV